jgi:DNA-binding transcriptional MerR regulator
MVYSRVVSEMPKETARRAAYRAAEVCEIARIQPYVLRSWESEFPKLGVTRGGVRIYRHADLEQVLRIKQLVFDEGLTLAGARRRLEEDREPQPELPLDEYLTPEMKHRLAQVRQALQDLLLMLGGKPRARAGQNVGETSGDGYAPAAAASADSTPPAPRKQAGRSRPKAARDKRSPHRRAGRHA